MAQRWLCGPAFLLQHAEKWTCSRLEQKCSAASNIASLVRSELCPSTNLHLQTNTEEKICGEMTYELSVINQLIMHYSTLPRLLRAISWWRRLICVFYNRIKRNLRVGDLVLLHGEPAIRYQFTKAVVTDVHPDKFGQVRRVTVRDADGKLFQHEVAKISLLEGDIDWPA